MGNQIQRLNLAGNDRLKKHGDRHGVDEACSDRDVMVPQLVQIQLNGLAMHANVGTPEPHCGVVTWNCPRQRKCD